MGYFRGVPNFVIFIVNLEVTKFIPMSSGRSHVHIIMHIRILRSIAGEQASVCDGSLHAVDSPFSHRVL